MSREYDWRIKLTLFLRCGQRYYYSRRSLQSMTCTPRLQDYRIWVCVLTLPELTDRRLPHTITHGESPESSKHSHKTSSSLPSSLFPPPGYPSQRQHSPRFRRPRQHHPKTGFLAHSSREYGRPFAVEFQSRSLAPLPSQIRHPARRSRKCECVWRGIRNESCGR